MLRVLEVGSGAAAAEYAGKLFVRWGHEVIRVEGPAVEPFSAAEHLHLNGGKRRIAGDYRDSEGRTELDRLAGSCDVVVIEVPAPHVREFALLDLGVTVSDGPAARIVITPFGLDGPYADVPATESTLMAMSGHTFLTGDPDREPLTVPGHYAAYQAGRLAYVVGLAAVLAPVAHGSRAIDLSILECLVGLHQYTDTRWIENQHVRRRHGNRVEHAASTMLPVVDGWVGFSLLQNFWESFAMMLGRPDLIEGHEFSTNDGRLAHRDEFEAFILGILGDRSKFDLFKDGQEVWRVPVGYTATLGDCLEDPHLAERGFWRPLPDVRLDDGRPLRVPGSPFRFIGDEHPEERSPEERVTSYEPSDLTAARHRRGLEDESAPLPLAGLRVLDLTQVWAGPLAARLLADLGAEVICIEPPTGRGPAKVPRGSTAYRIGDGIDEPWNFQPLFNKLHRNRKSVCLNLKAPGARELFLELVRKSDVVIENFSPRAMSRLKLTYDHLRGVNSQIIYASLPAFGQHGPYGQYIGYGPGVEPMTGIAAILGYEGDQPRVSGTAITDPMGGMAGAAGVLTALDRRARTGEGSWVDLSQHEASIALFGEFFIERQLSGRESERLPNCHPRHAPHGVYPCTGDDNWIAIAARDEDEWLTLCAMAGRGWNTDPRFTGVERRRKHRGELNGVISSWTSQREHQALASALRGAGVPAGAVLRSSEYLVDPHLSARGYFAALEHPRTGEWPSDGSPMRFEGSRGYDQWTPPPTLGEHNVEVLEEILGLSRTQIERLHAEGVIADAPP